MYVIVYNALSTKTSSIVQLPVSVEAVFNITRIDDDDDKLRTGSQIIHSVKSHFIASSSGGSQAATAAKYILNFETGVLPPVGAASFRIKLSDVSLPVMPEEGGDENEENEEDKDEGLEQDFVVSNGILTVNFDR
jgi:hypothetical protein